MIGTIRKHSTWMWAIIIVVVIITFVFWGSQPSRTGGDGGRVNLGTINGKSVTPEDYAKARAEVYLFYFRSTREWPDTDAKRVGFDVEKQTYFRLLLIQRQEQMGIHVSSDLVARAANNMLRSLNGGNPLPLDVFAKQVLHPRGLAVEDFERFVRHDIGMQTLAEVAGLAGKLVTLEEVRPLYERQHQEMSAQAVFFSASNYLAGIPATPEAVSLFYSNQMSRYRLPERVQVAYVKFPLSNYVAEATKQFNELTNLNEIIDAQYAKLGTNFFLEAKTEEEKKAKIREVMFKNQMLGHARKKANEFATALFKVEPMRAENLDALAKTNGMTVLLSQPFDREDGPKELTVGPDFIKAAFSLTVAEPFALPLNGDDGVYLIALHKNLPSENPPFDTVRDQVTHDYKFGQAVFQARNAGVAFETALTNGLSSGKSFTAMALEAKQTPVMPPPFSASTRSLTNVEVHVPLYQFKQAAFTTTPGAASVFTPTADGGFVVFVQAKLPIDEAKLRSELPEFLHSIRQSRLNESFNMWVSTEAQRDLGFRRIMEELDRRNRPATMRGEQ